MGGNLVLKKGEAGVYVVPADANNSIKAALLMKIGDGTTAFKDLPWLSGEAADVYEWAKQSSIYTTVSGSGNVISSVAWDKSLNGGKGGLSFTKGITALTSHQSIKNFYANNTDSLVPSAVPEEIAGSGTINLHRISKTGSYKDLRDKPDIGDGKITVTQNGVSKGEFTLNQTDGLTVSLTDTKYKLSHNGSKTTLYLNKSVDDKTFTADSEVNLATMLADIFVNTSGDTMTGALTLSGAPTAALHAATKQYVDQAIADQVVGAAKFFGTFGSDTEFGSIAGNIDSKGDFARCTTTYESSYFGTVHAGDIVVCTNYPFTTPETGFSVIHGETYTMNSATADGYVAKGSGNANKVWKTDEDGNPAWRDDADTAHTHAAGAGLTIDGSASTGGTSGTVTYKAKLKSETLRPSEATLASSKLLEPVVLDKKGVLAAYIPDRKIKFAYGEHHNFLVVDKNASETLEVFIPYVNSVGYDGDCVTISFKDIVNKDLDTNTT